MIHEYIETDRIKENLCMKFFKTCEELQKTSMNGKLIGRVSYKEIMPAMHISKERLQRVLNSIDRNWIYFKIEKGYTLEVSNIVMSVDWSKRVYYQDKPAYHFKIERYKTIR